MKIFTLSLLATTLLFSCQEEASLNSANEDIYKKRMERKINLENPPALGNGEVNNQVTTQQVPFDFGLSAVLGAGALAAFRTARKRRLAEK
jgi:hypothetical protein